MKLNHIDRGEIAGKRIFRVDCIVDCSLRNQIAEDAILPVDNSESSDESSQESTEPGIVKSVWRLISCVRATPQTSFLTPQIIDYSADNGEVLKQVVEKVNAVRPDLVWNHSDSSKDVAGYVANAYWENSSDIPPGVNATIVVDEEFDRRAAIGLKKGLLRNGSIGLTMDLTPSHPEMEWEEFVTRQGEVVDGEIVRWLPREVIEVRHMALVPAGMGADKYAGIRKITNTKSKNNSAAEGTMEISGVLTSILRQIGIDYVVVGQQIGDEVATKIIDRLRSLCDMRDTYQTLYAQLVQAGKSIFTEGDFTVEQVVKEIPQLVALANTGRQLIDIKKQEALEWYDRAHVDVPVNSVVRDRISNCDDLEHLVNIIAEYKAIAEHKFELNRKTTDQVSEIEFPEPSQDIAESVERIFTK